MKANELLARATCSVCSQPIGRAKLPLFWTVRIERHGIKLDAVRRHDGLIMVLGSAQLAEVMGPGEELTQAVMKPVELTICERCMLEKFPELADRALRNEQDGSTAHHPFE